MGLLYLGFSMQKVATGAWGALATLTSGSSCENQMFCAEGQGGSVLQGQLKTSGAWAEGLSLTRGFRLCVLCSICVIHAVCVCCV